MATYTFDKIEYGGNTYVVSDSGALQLTGGQVTGPVTFGDSITVDEATLGDLVVNGNASFTNNIQANTINGVTVGSSPKFTDTVTTVTSSGSGNAVTAISASNGAITVTKGSTFLTASSTLDATKLSGTIPAGCYTDTNTTYTLTNALASHKFTWTFTAGGSGSGSTTTTAELVAGTGITLTDDTSNKKITIASNLSTFQSTTATLTTAGWSSNAQTVSVTGVTASNIVIVSPAPSSYADYCTCGVFCSAQGAGTLTFTCGETPPSALTVNVLYK